MHTNMYTCTSKWMNKCVCVCVCRLDGQTDALTQEVGLDFTRAMNRILFDKTVSSSPATFPFVTLPEPEEVQVPRTGNPLGMHACMHVNLYTVHTGTILLVCICLLIGLCV